MTCLFALIVLISLTSHCGKTPDVKNRVPNFSVNGQELADLKQQLADTKAAAQTAQASAASWSSCACISFFAWVAAAKDAKQPDNKPATTTPDEPKEGRLEATRPGIITDFGEYDLAPASNIKRFFPVCPGQTVKTGTPITIMYHWRSWQENQEGKRGCYQIDGFQTQWFHRK